MSTNSSEAADPVRILSSATNISTPSKQAYTTEIVKALFGGGAVGDVIQDFSCSFQRQAGRIYISTDALFFYSNLFGFEKKIRIDFDQTLEITKLRSTSLSVLLRNGDEYVFRSFEDREQVLCIILGYYSNNRVGANGDDDATPVPPSTSALEGVNAVVHEKSFDETENQSSAAIDDKSSPPVPSEDSPQNSEQTEDFEGGDASGKDTSTDRHDESFATKQFEEMKQQTEGWESLVALEIRCKSVEKFFELFLKDDAINSLDKFGSAIGDTNMFITSWKTTNDNNTMEDTTNNIAKKSLQRMIRLERKAGMSLAKVTRQQTYHFFGNQACLRNITKAEGIKALPKDSFSVEDIWIIQDTENGSIAVDVKFRVIFLKNMGYVMKNIIQNRSKAETNEYYNKYASFVRQKMQLKTPLQEAVAPSIVTADAAKKGDWFWVMRSIHQYVLSALHHNAPISFLGIIVAFIIYRLTLRVIFLEEALEEFERRLFELEKSRPIDEALLFTTEHS